MNNLLLLGRISLFVIFFWFGLLKVLGISPAEPLVHNLFDQLLSGWIPFSTFNKLFGLAECGIGIIWLIPNLTKMATIILLVHMTATFLPVFFLPNDTWQDWFTPTLVGQYIIKNLALISLGLFILKLNENKSLIPA
ncbi:hypothetical protein DFQ04_0654 [Algoriphagus boseongensis]|uniref:Membrane protein YkgB n=1 Tax=Algoriphagus boseongensis TaxID=1442587 RepID=A0A4R6TBK4_9BACT|nr:hypothetical protein [Algoriphagus boseongensis]TDQ18844.1 hypothetical protein DFQ04_0654 [Algoriphagus boseongensis]